MVGVEFGSKSTDSKERLKPEKGVAMVSSSGLHALIHNLGHGIVRCDLQDIGERPAAQSRPTLRQMMTIVLICLNCSCLTKLKPMCNAPLLSLTHTCFDPAEAAAGSLQAQDAADAIRGT